MTMSKSDIESVPVIQVLERANKLLDYIAMAPEGLPLKKLAELTQLHPSTTHRIIWNLQDAHLIERDSKGMWRLGYKFYEYGLLYSDRLTIRSVALPFLQSLHNLTGLTINLGLKQGDNVVFVAHIFNAETRSQLSTKIGAKAPLHCSSCGKIFLSQLSLEERRAYINRTGLKGLAPKSITDASQLIINLDRIKEFGWSEDNEELERGYRCLGAPIYDKTGTVVAAVSMVSAITTPKDPRWITRLVQTAEAISEKLGYVGH